MPVKWQQERFKRVLIANLMANAEIVGEFVESDARRRLHAIKDPEWGRAYRQEIVSRLLRNQVAQKRNEVEIKVGVAVSGESRHHGFYIEMGSATAPAHPYLRPAVFQNGRRIVALLAGK